MVGGGSVGRRKAAGLIEAGARVRLISPGQIEPPLPEHVEIVRRSYRSGDLEGAALVFAATDSAEINSAVLRDAREAGIPANMAEEPDEGDFALPALLRRGDLTVAVGTSGESPALAALVRDRLSEHLGEEWGTVLEIAAALRQKRLTCPRETIYNSAVLRQLLSDGLPFLVAARDTAGIDRLLETRCGKGSSLADLKIRLSEEIS